MANNSNLAEHSKATQFGQPNGVDPKLARAIAKPGSVRNALRRIGAQRTGSEQDMTPEKIAAMLYPGAKLAGLTMAERVAVKKFQVAVLEGNTSAMDKIEESIDGKLIQPTMNADFDVIRNMSDEELLEYANRINGFNSVTNGSSGQNGIEPESGSKSDVGGQTSGPETPGDPTGV